MSAKAFAPESQLWDWEALFEEVDYSFLWSMQRNLYAFHTLERLEVLVLTLTYLKDHLEN